VDTTTLTRAGTYTLIIEGRFNSGGGTAGYNFKVWSLPVEPSVPIVSHLNEPPIARNDDVVTSEDTPIVINPLINDEDPDSAVPLQVTSFTPASHGTVTQLPNGQLRYAPFANFFGNDSFTYTASDGDGAAASALVALTVLPVNDSPCCG
jgi:hypothetical protein